jgi:hypothetical protein
MPYLVGVLMYAVLLVVLNVRPGWEAAPFLTDAAAPVIELLNLAIIGALVAQAVSVVDENPRVRAIASYGISLLCLAAVAQLWTLFPFDFGSWGEGWPTATRMVLVALFAWAFICACRSAVRLVCGRRMPRLAACHA